MIYVTVGTHEQPFNRLVQCVDELKGKGIIEDEVVIQYGFSDYAIKNCTHKQLFGQHEMIENYEKARMIIMHGGPSSMIQSIQDGKIPIVVPRQKKFGEHINDHQLEFCRAVSERYDNIILIENIDDLENVIVNYDEIAGTKKAAGFNNNAKFIEGLNRIVDGLWK